MNNYAETTLPIDTIKEIIPDNLRGTIEHPDKVVMHGPMSDGAFKKYSDINMYQCGDKRLVTAHIMVEGPDNSGKTTMVTESARYLASLGWNVLVVREPPGWCRFPRLGDSQQIPDPTPFKPSLDVLRDQMRARVGLYHLTTYYEGMGYIIISDRGFPSSYVHQGPEYSDYSSIMKHFYSHIHPPLWSFFMNRVDVDTLMERHGECDNPVVARRMYEVLSDRYSDACEGMRDVSPYIDVIRSGGYSERTRFLLNSISNELGRLFPHHRNKLFGSIIWANGSYHDQI